MRTQVVITGVEGFAGSHLAEHLHEQGLSVHGTVNPSAHMSRNLAHLPRTVVTQPCDIRRYPDVASLIAKVRPDIVFHLAAISSVMYGEEHPEELFATNLSGTVHILQAVRKYVPHSTVVVISSPEVYGTVAAEECPLNEDHPLKPVHLYGVSKALSEKAALFYHHNLNLNVVILRPFNHIGPRQSDSFVCSSFCKQAALIDLKLAPPVIHVGNLSAIRDFTDVRDMVVAYRLAAEQCKPGEPYHIASGIGRTIKEILDIVCSFVGTKIRIEQDPARLRAIETPVFIGDASRFVQQTTWKPRFSLSQSLYDCFTVWKEQVRSMETSME